MKLDKKKIDILRADNVMTIRNLAQRAGVSTSSIVYCDNVEATTAGKIAKALGVSVREILVGDEDA